MSDEIENKREHKRRRTSEAEELKEIAAALPDLFGALNESIPKLISGLIGSVYSPEAASNMATAIGQFYSKLVTEGIPEDAALEMTKKFVGALDFSKMMSLIGDESKHKRKKPDFVDEDEESD